jgi:hypothetical protein
MSAAAVTAAIRTPTSYRELAVGVVTCLQTDGSRSNWQLHPQLLVTAGRV